MIKSDVDSARSSTIEALKTSISGKAFDNIVVGGNVEKSKTGCYVQISQPLTKSLNTHGIPDPVK